MAGRDMLMGIGRGGLDRFAAEDEPDATSERDHAGPAELLIGERRAANDHEPRPVGQDHPHPVRHPAEQRMPEAGEPAVELATDVDKATVHDGAPCVRNACSPSRYIRAKRLSGKWSMTAEISHGSTMPQRSTLV